MVIPNSPQTLSHAPGPIYVWQNPRRAIDRNGRLVDTTGEIWPLNDASGPIQINWASVDTGSDIKDALKAYVFHAIEAQAPGSSGTIFFHMKYVLNEVLTVTSLVQLDYAALEAVLKQLREYGSAWKFGHVRRWYRWCSNQKIPGFSKEIAERLYRLKVPTNAKGVKVMSRDPERGPFSDQEHWLLRQAVKNGRGSFLTRVCVMLLLELGARPIQLVLLTIADFKVTLGSDGTQKFYALDVPRVKQRTVGKLAKKRRRISHELGQVLEDLVRKNQLKHGDSDSEMPILCRPIPATEGVRKRNRHPLQLPRDSFQKRVVSFASEANIISPRTGKLLNTYPIRFRYTFATRHANQGTPATVLSELMDHSNLASIRIYTKSTSNFVERLNVALGTNDQYTSIIGRFLGEISSSAENRDPHRIINGTTPTLKNLGGIGACGADFLCKLMPPLSCYICPKFQAWSDGPHEQMLRELEIYVLDLMQRSMNKSDRIPYQLTEVITAIRSLLVKLEEPRKGGINAQH
jgi:integrase